MAITYCFFFLQKLFRSPGLEHHYFTSTNAILKSTSCLKQKSSLFGIFTIASKVDLRNIIRRATQCNFNTETHTTIFVLGMPSTNEERHALLDESLTHQDILVLPCEENMNEDKTFHFFKAVFTHFPCYDFYVKTDDDTAFNPTRIVQFITQHKNNDSLYIGRKMNNTNKDIFSFVFKSVLFKFRDMQWLYGFDSFFAGMLYILNRRSVELWMQLNSTQHYGDEDMVTSYYMTKINATYQDVDTRFHDNVNYSNFFLFNHWKSPITESSMAVHKCKSLSDLTNALNQLCV